MFDAKHVAQREKSLLAGAITQGGEPPAASARTRQGENCSGVKIEIES